MAENEDGQEKSEDPTAKRKEESKKKGQVARSRELTTLLMLIASIMGIMIMGGHVGETLQGVMSNNFSLSRAEVYDLKTVLTHFYDSVVDTLWALTPFFTLMVAVALIAPLLLGGWSFSSDPLVPKYSKMDPLKGLKRMFGLQGFVEFIKALLKVLLLGAIAVYVLWETKNILLALSREPLDQAIAHVMEILTWQFLAVSLGMIAVAAIDAPYQLWNHHRQLKMTKQEVKDEHKQTEGNPEIKGRVRQLQQQMAQQRMMADVPEADVVVTNPTHYAVALKYKEDMNRAPEVVAKGTDLIAAQIRGVADANDVPVIAAPALSRSLYYSAEIGDEIPAGLYMAVAQVLAYIFQLREGMASADSSPDFEDLPIPDELKR